MAGEKPFQYERDVRNRVLSVAIAILPLLAQTAVAGDLADVQRRGKLIMLCYPVQQSNFVAADLDVMREHRLRLKDMRSPDQFKGLDVDLIAGFARSLGVQLEIHAVPEGYDALLPTLVAREGDLVASSLTSTPHRLQSADFSDPYLTSWVVVATRHDSPIASLSDLKGKKVAVMRGSSQLELLDSLGPDIQRLVTDFSLESYVAVKQGAADFTLMDSPAPVGESVSKSYPDLKVALRVRDFGYGVALRKNSDLMAPLNAYIAGLKQSGEIERLTARHFAAPPAGKPSTNP